MINDKKVLYSGMQATGTLTLGNYLGHTKNRASLYVVFQWKQSICLRTQRQSLQRKMQI